VMEVEANGVRYLRVEEGDLGHLMVAVMQEIFGLTPSDEVDLQIEGFHLSDA
jgi:hypothetical protein